MNMLVVVSHRSILACIMQGALTHTPLTSKALRRASGGGVRAVDGDRRLRQDTAVQRATSCERNACCTI
jgi:hypothetical protein